MERVTLEELGYKVKGTGSRGRKLRLKFGREDQEQPGRCVKSFAERKKVLRKRLTSR